MQIINFATVVALSDQSERTLRRKISDGTLTRLLGDNAADRVRVTMPFDATTQSYLSITLDDESLALIEQADAGNAEAQNDLGLRLLAERKAKKAIYWLELAAKQNYADAMHWLGRCHIDGNGVEKNEDLGIMWLAKAAAQGHVISREMIQAMKDRFVEP